LDRNKSENEEDDEDDEKVVGRGLYGDDDGDDENDDVESDVYPEDREEDDDMEEQDEAAHALQTREAARAKVATSGQAHKHASNDNSSDDEYSASDKNGRPSNPDCLAKELGFSNPPTSPYISAARPLVPVPPSGSGSPTKSTTS
jgi:hypothetical protein